MSITIDQDGLPITMDIEQAKELGQALLEAEDGQRIFVGE